ncbi:BrnA antitoxin family protein [Methylobacterium sp. WL120]|nr:BrnA antitoxin family protein [Methylobacterium sp. WL120]TXM70092.1 BrnA antitoxin family protein [Methylobacterium sp. WL120]
MSALVRCCPEADWQRSTHRGRSGWVPSVRFSPLAHFRAGGPGWQARIGAILLDAIERERRAG